MTATFRFGTVGSPKSTPKKPGGTVGGIQRSAELELTALELGWVRSVRVSEKTCQLIRCCPLWQPGRGNGHRLPSRFLFRKSA
jgi:hypothetical protein